MIVFVFSVKLCTITTITSTNSGDINDIHLYMQMFKTLYKTSLQYHKPYELLKALFNYTYLITYSSKYADIKAPVQPLKTKF